MCKIMKNITYNDNIFFRESGKETCNFRQFVKTLAHFRPFDSSKENPLNTREKKLKCKLAFIGLILTDNVLYPTFTLRLLILEVLFHVTF